MADAGPDPALEAEAHEAEPAAVAAEPAPTTGSPGTRVVGLGGSAGGIPALQRFFTAMPADSGMAFVVVLHLSPTHESILAEVLQRSTSMTVVPAAQGLLVEPNHVYVIPPGKLLSLREGRLQLGELPRTGAPRTTVDLFFRSLADSQGPSAVAIVLSGGDGDGAIGIKRIKERGGLTIAQEPEDAEHPGMPLAAIQTSMVDWVLRAEEMPPRLMQYQARERRLRVPPEDGPHPGLWPRSSAEDEEDALRDVLSFLRARTSRDFSYYKRATIVRRIARRMQVNELDSLPAYLDFLRTRPGEAESLLKDLLISVTHFFRDREVFGALQRLIPALFEGKSESDTLRVWVPACATGEEAYSIAMLLSEHARTLDAPPVLQIFATDLDEEALSEARLGLYPDAIAADVSAERLHRFFIKEPQGYRVRRELRELLLFAVHDLLKDSPFSRLDLISCRNLLIYLNGDAQRQAFETFHFALRPGGRLMLGVSEAVDDASSLFQPIDKKRRIYAVRFGSRAHLPVPAGVTTLGQALGAGDPEPSATLAMRVPHSTAASAVNARGRSAVSWSELHLRLIERFGPPSVVIDAEQDIVHLSAGAAPFLQFSGGEPSTNLLRVVHPMLRNELRAALFRARQLGEPVSVMGVPIDLAEVRRAIDLRVYPAAELAPDFSLVTFVLHDEGERPPRSQENEEPLVVHLERELEHTKSELREVIEQHEASIEELKASNEELQAMNEELRSATEELETSREELQSINEELTTVNNELKLKLDELGHANSDLHNLMGATAIATVFLDRELRIMRFTPSALELFSLISTDVGRPLADLHHRLDYPLLLRDAASVLQQLVPVEREVSDDAGRHFLARLLPYRTIDDRIAGVVLTFVDVTERHAAQSAMRGAQQNLERRVQERTAELDTANLALRSEMLGHLRADKDRQELQRLLINAQEEERGRISRELHDEVGQQLTALMLSLKSLESAAEGETHIKLRELRDTAERAGREIHQLATELRPIALDQLGLTRALAGYLESWQSRTGIHVDFVSLGLSERLPKALETTLYRVVQEAMNNVYKHASAKNVSVSLERRGSEVLGIIEDDGTGFDVEAVERSSGPRIGIAGMNERAKVVGGELTVDASSGSGTVVRVRLPIPA